MGKYTRQLAREEAANALLDRLSGTLTLVAGDNVEFDEPRAIEMILIAFAEVVVIHKLAQQEVGYGD